MPSSNIRPTKRLRCTANRGRFQMSKFLDDLEAKHKQSGEKALRRLAEQGKAAPFPGQKDKHSRPAAVSEDGKANPPRSFAVH